MSRVFLWKPAAIFILISLFFARSKIAEFHLSTNIINSFFFLSCLSTFTPHLPAPLSPNPSLRFWSLLPARFHIYATVHYGFLFLCDVKKKCSRRNRSHSTRGERATGQTCDRDESWRLDNSLTCGWMNVTVYCWMLPCCKATLMHIFHVMSEPAEVLVWRQRQTTTTKSQTLLCVHLFLPLGASRFHRSQSLMHAVTDAVRRDGGWKHLQNTTWTKGRRQQGETSTDL